MSGGSRVAAVLLASCLVALSGPLAGCEASPAGAAEASASPLPRDVSAGEDRTPPEGSGRVAKREVRAEGEPASECLEVEVLTNKTYQPIRHIMPKHYSFFLRPRPEFKDIKFNMMIDNLWNLAGPYESAETIVFSLADVEEAAERQRWVEVTADYFKHEVVNGRDKLGLRVTVGNVTREMISSRWWRTHKFDGFLLSARGPATLLFDCPPQKAAAPEPVRLMNTPVLMGGILVLAFLLVVVPWVCFVFRRRANADLNEAPDVPPLPKSLVRVFSKSWSRLSPIFCSAFFSDLCSLQSASVSYGAAMSMLSFSAVSSSRTRLLKVLILRLLPPLLEKTILDCYFFAHRNECRVLLLLILPSPQLQLFL